MSLERVPVILNHAISPGSWPGLSRPPRFCLLCALTLGVAGTSPATTAGCNSRRLVRPQACRFRARRQLSQIAGNPCGDLSTDQVRIVLLNEVSAWPGMDGPARDWPA